MALHITPRTLVAAYDLIRSAPPVSRWALPDADDVEFHAVGTVSWVGFCIVPPAGAPQIKISAPLIGSTPLLLSVMAHEMVHLHQFRRRTARSHEHNAEFRRLAAQIARIHGFDPHWIAR